MSKINWNEYKGDYTYSTSKNHYYKYSKVIDHEKAWVLEFTQGKKVYDLNFPHTKEGEMNIDNIVLALISSSLPQDNKDNKDNDPVNPKHYKGRSGQDLLDVFNDFNMVDHNKCTALEYIFRSGKKYQDKEIEDLQKAIKVLQRKVKFLKGDLI